jgi:decaprenylphospho-beta-D-ribofuranose 2-oxidase
VRPIGSIRHELVTPASGARYLSFDGGVAARCQARFPDRYAFWDTRTLLRQIIPQGAGLSYAAASFSPHATVIEHQHLNRILSFDATAQTIEVEAGIELGALYEFLAPRDFYLPVQPGHPRITVGGCIASDAHGKNQFRDGTFKSQVRSLRLFHPLHGTLDASRSLCHEIFDLTCGGYGLTGNILSATLRLTPLPSRAVNVTVIPLDEAEGIADQLENIASTHDLVYTWHNFTDQRRFGHSCIVCGAFAPDTGSFEQSLLQHSGGRLTSRTRGSWRVPFFNSLSVPVFNRAYMFAGRIRKKRARAPLRRFLFPVEPKEAYFRLFGKRGFMEYQVIVPRFAYPEFVRDVRQRLFRKPIPITLASAKYFGGDSQLLRFTGSGVCLVLDFPRTVDGKKFAEYLDQLLPVFGARPNIIKDSRLPAEVVARTYSEYEYFRQRLRDFDPKRLYGSELSERLRL